MSVIIRVTKSVVVGLLVSSLDTFRDHWPSNLSVILLGALAFTTVVRPSSFYRDDKDETTAYIAMTQKLLFLFCLKNCGLDHQFFLSVALMIRFDFIVQIHTLKHVTVLQCKDTTVLKQKPLQLNNPRQ